MLTQAMIEALRCPVCRTALSQEDRALRCANGHSFDIAKQGYVNLGAGRKLPDGDTAPMIEARERFLATGHYRPLIEALSEVVPRDGFIVDLGGGTGYYLAALLSRNIPPPTGEGLVLDVSKAALKRAAKRAGAVLADTWHGIPLRDGVAKVVLNVFAPRNGAEIHRILGDGLLIVVTPAPDHLGELRRELGLLDIDESKADRLQTTLRDFTQESQTQLTWQMALTDAEATDLIMMGPNAFHTQQPQVKAMTVTASMVITTWRGRLLPNRPADRGTAR